MTDQERDEALRLARELIDDLELGDPYEEPPPEEYRLARALLALREENRKLQERLKFTHPVFEGAKSAPAHYEADGAFPDDRTGVYRIVLDETARRWREEYKTTARPEYIATVYSHDYAVMFAWTVSNMENWIRHGNSVEAERDQLREENRKLRAVYEAAVAVRHAWRSVVSINTYQRESRDDLDRAVDAAIKEAP